MPLGKAYVELFRPAMPLVRICCLESVQRLHLHEPKCALEKTNGKPCSKAFCIWCRLFIFVSVCLCLSLQWILARLIARDISLPPDPSAITQPWWIHCQESWLNWCQGCHWSQSSPWKVWNSFHLSCGETGSCTDSRWVGPATTPAFLCCSPTRHVNSVEAAGGQVDTVQRLKFAELEPANCRNCITITHLSTCQTARGTSRGAQSSAEKHESAEKTVWLHLQALYMKMCTNQAATWRVAELKIAKMRRMFKTWGCHCAQAESWCPTTSCSKLPPHSPWRKIL